MHRWRKAAVYALVLALLLSSYAAALTLPEAKTLASTPEAGDVLLQWSPDNPWPGSVVSRSDGTTVWMETNFWNINSGDGENYMRFIASEDKVAFYVNMTNVQTKYGGNAFATPNVVFVGRSPQEWWGGKPVMGGYNWFSLPMNGAEIGNLDSVWTRVNFELAKGEGTLARTGLIMWFESTFYEGWKGGWRLGEVYITFSDDYGGIANTQYPPVDLGTLEATVYVDGAPKEVTFTIQRTWHYDHFVIEFVPNEAIAPNGGDVLIDVKPFAEAVVQAIVDDPYSSWTPDQIVWTSIGFGTYTGSNSDSFELGWILHDARVVPKSAQEKTTTNWLFGMSFYYHYRYNIEKVEYEKLIEEAQIEGAIEEVVRELVEQAEAEYEAAVSESPGSIYLGFGSPAVFSHLRKAFVFMRDARLIAENAITYSQILEEYKVFLEAAKTGDVDPAVISKAEALGNMAQGEYQEALSSETSLELLKHLRKARDFLAEAVDALKEVVSLGEFRVQVARIKELASTKEADDVHFTWWDQWLEQAIERSDGTTVWMQTNFWNIVGGDGEVFMRYVKATDEFAFYVNLKNVQTQWGGIAWATPEVIFAGRVPKVWWGDKPPVGGYDFIQLPMDGAKLKDYDHIWVKANYEMVRRDDTLVRFGLLMWFEYPDEGWPAAEIYVPFSDDYNGLVGVDGRTEVGKVTTSMVVNGTVIPNVTLTIQRGWNPGNWWSYEFIPEIQVTSGEVYIDIKPIVEKVFSEFSGLSVTWTSISLGSYSGGKDPAAGFEYGWIIHDVGFVPGEEVPGIR